MITIDQAMTGLKLSGIEKMICYECAGLGYYNLHGWTIHCPVCIGEQQLTVSEYSVGRLLKSIQTQEII